MNLLAAVRLSRHRGEADPSTSPDRQEATINDWAAEEAHKIIGWAYDLDVSAITFDPFERPELGDWLTNRTREFDGVVWAKLDRAIRKMDDLHKLAIWAAEKKKVLFIASGPAKELRLDLSGGKDDAISKIILTILAFAAQMEGEAIRERNRSTREYLRSIGRWPGGMYPYHTKPKQLKGGNGWKLDHNEETVEIVEQIIDKVLDRRSKNSIAAELNSDGVLSPREYRLTVDEKILLAPVTGVVIADHPEAEYRAKKPRFIKIQPAEGDPVVVNVFPRNGELDVAHGELVSEGTRLLRPILWNPNTIHNMLRSRALIGHTELDGKPLLGPDGMPVRRVDPLIERDEWERLQRVLDETSVPSGRTRSKGASLMLDAGFCAACGSKIHLRQPRMAEKTYGYYGCRSKWGGIARQGKDTRCKSRTITKAVLEHTVEQILLAEIGHVEVQETVFIAGESHAAELRDAEDAHADLLQRSAGKKGRVLASYENQIARLEETITRLADLPDSTDRTELRATGKTYAQKWQDGSQDDRRQLLVDSGITVFFGHGDDLSALRSAQQQFAGPFRRSVEVTVSAGHTFAIVWGDDIAQRLAQATAAKS